MKLHQKLRQIRRQLGLTQAQLAEKMGVSTRTITNYESGNRIPGADYIARFSELTGVTSDYFLNKHLQETYPGRMRSHNRTTTPEESRAKMDLLLAEIAALFTGGGLNARDKENFLRAVGDIYFKSQKADTPEESGR